MKKTRLNKGETLVESLAAVLVFTLTSIALFTMLSTANKLNKTAKETDENYRDEIAAVEKADSGHKDGTVKVILKGENGKSDITIDSVSVDVYSGSNKANALHSYFLKTNGGTK